MLEACGLTKRFAGVTVLKDVNFTLVPSQVLGCVGPNGAGKTTTIRILTGLLEPTSGFVRFNGREIREDLVGFRRLYGYVPEEPHLYPFLSGREHLELVGRLRGIEARLLERKISGFLELFGLSGDAEQAIGSYSKGMRQKILLGAALLHNPPILIFDEPLSGLDVTAALVFRHLIRALAERNKMILYSSHVLGVVEDVCSTVLVLHKGKVVANDSMVHLRDLMALHSLEEVFAQLVTKEEPERIARDIADLAAL